MRVAAGQHSDRLGVQSAAGRERAESDAVVVPDMGGRVVPNAPAGFHQAPDQVDVLPDVQRIVEPHAGGLTAHDQGGARHVLGGEAGPHESSVGTHVERRVARLVASDDAVAGRQRSDTWRNGSDAGIGEVPQQ